MPDTTLFVRTCQKCGHKQVAGNPAKYTSDLWRNLSCLKCKSIAMDYGSFGWEKKNGQIVRIPEEK